MKQNGLACSTQGAAIHCRHLFTDLGMGVLFSLGLQIIPNRSVPRERG